jgi:hypothetical protein
MGFLKGKIPCQPKIATKNCRFWHENHAAIESANPKVVDFRSNPHNNRNIFAENTAFSHRSTNSILPGNIRSAPDPPQPAVAGGGNPA